VATETLIKPGAQWKPQTPDGFTDVSYETADGIAKITICRPEVRNAFRPRTLFELRDAFELGRGEIRVDRQDRVAGIPRLDRRLRNLVAPADDRHELAFVGHRHASVP